MIAWGRSLKISQWFRGKRIGAKNVLKRWSLPRFLRSVYNDTSICQLNEPFSFFIFVGVIFLSQFISFVLFRFQARLLEPAHVLRDSNREAVKDDGHDVDVDDEDEKKKKSSTFGE